MIISSTGTAEHATPYHASTVEAKLGFTGIPAFDLNAACSGLVYAITVGGAMLQTDGCRNVLVTASEKMSYFTDYKDRSSCILFGDGAASILLSNEKFEHEIIAAELGVDPSGNDLIQMGGYKTRFYFWQDGKNVYRFVIPKIGELIAGLKEKCNIGPKDNFYIIPHQANRRMIESVSDKYKIPMDRFVLNMDRYGNTSSASIGLALHEAKENKLFKKGDAIFLIGFGAGISWGAAAIRW
jgi:3-oxoacyl-[acyl-carrier-protein] synthase III